MAGQHRNNPRNHDRDVHARGGFDRVRLRTPHPIPDVVELRVVHARRGAPRRGLLLSQSRGPCPQGDERTSGGRVQRFPRLPHRPGARREGRDAHARSVCMRRGLPQRVRPGPYPRQGPRGGHEAADGPADRRRARGRHGP